MFGDEEKPAPPIDPGLAAASDAIDDPASPGGTPGASPAAPLADPATVYADEAKQLLDFMCASLFPISPSLEKVYTPEARSKIVAAAGPLLAKYDFSFLRWLAKYAPELNFAMATLPLVVPTIDAIKADRAAAKKREAEEKAAKAAAPAST
jgi:hypothetical protein